MQDFFTQHWAIAATVINVMAGVIVVLGTALVRIKFNHISEEQRYQNRRLGYLEEDVGKLKGDGRQVAEQMRSLSKTLEQYLEETRQRADRYEERNDRTLAEIKSLIKREAVRATP